MLVCDDLCMSGRTSVAGLMSDPHRRLSFAGATVLFLIIERPVLTLLSLLGGGRQIPPRGSVRAAGALTAAAGAAHNEPGSAGTPSERVSPVVSAAGGASTMGGGVADGGWDVRSSTERAWKGLGAGGAGGNGVVGEPGELRVPLLGPESADGQDDGDGDSGGIPQPDERLLAVGNGSAAV